MTTKIKLFLTALILTAVIMFTAQINNPTGGSGTVTSVSGTANQIDVATGTTTPAISLDAAITLPGTINKYTLTAPATGSTLAIADGKTLTASNSLTLAGTDATTQTFAGLSGHPWSVISAQATNTDTVSCPNNTTANFASTYTIPANYLVTNKILRVTLTFRTTTSGTPPSIGARMTIGGTAVYLGTQVAPTISQTDAPLAYTFLIQGSAAASGSAAVYTSGVPAYQLATSALGPFNATSSFVVQPVNLATNGTLVIQPQIFCSANTAGNSWTLQQMVVESD